MRFYHGLAFLLLSLTVFTGCGEDAETPEEPVDEIQNGDIHGTVTDEETSEPLEGASVNIGGTVVLTGADGKYAVQGVSFSDKIEVSVTAVDYREYKSTISLDQSLAFFNVSLAPIDGPIAQILDVLEALSEDIEALDPGRIPAIKSYFSEDYVAANDFARDQATIFAVMAGVVPPDFDGLPETIQNIVNKYDKLEFRFADPDVDFDEDEAFVLMRFEIYAETKPKQEPEMPARKWEIVVDGRLVLRRENGDWKMTFWQLIAPFLKFEDEPLEQ